MRHITIYHSSHGTSHVDIIDKGRRFRQAFSRRHVVLPVIHVASLPLALKNTDTAVTAGADGVFLINHSMAFFELLEIYAAVVKRFPSTWIGLNCLDLSAKEVFQRVPPTVDGIWVDNAGIDEMSHSQLGAEAVIQAQK